MTAYRLIVIACIAAIAAMTTGCQPAMDAYVRSALGFNSVPPQMNSIASYPTNDPDTKIFLSYLGALEKDLLGIKGEMMDSTTQEAEIKRAQGAMKRSFETVSVNSAEQNFAFIEKWGDEQRRMGPQHYLTVLPAGANPKESGARIFKLPVTGNEEIEAKTTQITLVYTFSSPQEVAQKAKEITEKLRPVFATQTGWQFQDSAFLKEQTRQSVLLIQNNKDIGPEAKRKNLKHFENMSKLDDAGRAMIQYFYASGYRSQVGPTSIPAYNMMQVMIMPNFEPEFGGAALSVLFSRSLNQPRHK